MNALRLEFREHRVEMRTFHGMPSDELSGDGEQLQSATPIRGVPTTYSRKGTKS